MPRAPRSQRVPIGFFFLFTPNDLACPNFTDDVRWADADDNNTAVLVSSRPRPFASVPPYSTFTAVSDWSWQHLVPDVPRHQYTGVLARPRLRFPTARLHWDAAVRNLTAIMATTAPGGDIYASLLHGSDLQVICPEDSPFFLGHDLQGALLEVVVIVSHEYFPGRGHVFIAVMDGFSRILPRRYNSQAQYGIA